MSHKESRLFLYPRHFNYPRAHHAVCVLLSFPQNKALHSLNWRVSFELHAHTHAPKKKQKEERALIHYRSPRLNRHDSRCSRATTTTTTIVEQNGDPSSGRDYANRTNIVVISITDAEITVCASETPKQLQSPKLVCKSATRTLLRCLV